MKFLEAHTYGAWSLSTHDGSRLKTLHECVVLEGVVRANPTVSDKKWRYLKFRILEFPTKDMKILWNFTYNKKGMVIEVICWEKPDYKSIITLYGLIRRFAMGLNPKGLKVSYNQIKQGTGVYVLFRNMFKI